METKTKINLLNKENELKELFYESKTFNKIKRSVLEDINIISTKDLILIKIDKLFYHKKYKDKICLWENNLKNNKEFNDNINKIKEYTNIIEKNYNDFILSYYNTYIKPEYNIFNISWKSFFYTIITPTIIYIIKCLIDMFLTKIAST